MLPGRQEGRVWCGGDGGSGSDGYDDARAIMRPKMRLNGLPMLNFNEGKVCDAIVRRLEARADGSRSGLRWPEQERHAFPVEVAFTIGDQLFALEHTGIEPFKGHVQMDAEADRLFKPIVDALKNALGAAAVFELMIPANALRGRKMPEVRGIQQALIAWVKATAPTVPAQRYGDYKKTSVGPVTIPGVPFAVSLYRFEPALVPGHHFQLTHLVKNGEQLRKDRIREAVERKFPKLAAWKRDENARTILVLEDNDIQLTNQAIVTETYLPLAYEPGGQARRNLSRRFVHGPMARMANPDRRQILFRFCSERQRRGLGDRSRRACAANAAVGAQRAGALFALTPNRAPPQHRRQAQRGDGGRRPSRSARRGAP